MDNEATSATSPSSVAAPAATAAATSSPAVSSPASTGTTSPAAGSTTTGTTTASADSTATQDTTSVLTPEQTVEAMVAAAADKGFGEKKVEEPEIPVVEQPTSVEEPAKTDAAVEAGKSGSEGAQDDDESYSLEEDGFIGAKDLAAKIEANEALKAALPEDVRNEIMANARLAEFGASLREYFASPEEAKIVSESAQQFAGVIEAFQGVGTDVQKGTTALVEKILELSALRNADGTLMKNDKGQYITDNTAGKFFDTIFERKFGAAITSKVKALGDENVQAALDLVMESVGLRPSSADKDQLGDPALAARKAELDAREAEITRQSAATKQETWKAYSSAVEGDLNSLYEGAVGKLLDGATALNEFTRGAVENELASAVKTAIRTNTAYQMERKRIEAMPPTPERRQAEVALAKRFFRVNLARISKPVMAKAGIVVSQKIEERKAAQAARAENVRSEINGGAPTQPVQPGNGQNATQQRETIAANLKAQTGHDPSESDITVALMLAAAKAKGYPTN